MVNNEFEQRRQTVASGLAEHKLDGLLVSLGPNLPKTQITQFLKQSMDAENAGDMRLADRLSQRALVLAKELEGGQ